MRYLTEFPPPMSLPMSIPISHEKVLNAKLALRV
jgi:hypothetical protein